jgi:hypothetical protein
MLGLPPGWDEQLHSYLITNTFLKRQSPPPPPSNDNKPQARTVTSMNPDRLPLPAAFSRRRALKPQAIL